MKANIHPQFFATAMVVCACGHTWQTGSTKETIHTEICSNCHPFFTGKQNLIDTAGTVDRFKKKQAQALAAKAKVKEKKPRKTRAPKK